MERRKWLNLPNSISSSRLLLAFVFVIVDGTWQRVVLILSAGATDFLDGWLARRAKSSSVAGALIDPIADRVFVLAAVSSYLVEGKLSTGQYFIFLSRDIATAVGFIVARFIPGLTAGSFKARPLGKAVTVLQLVALFAVLLAPASIDWIVLIIGGLSALSIVDYTAALERARRAARSGRTLTAFLAMIAGMLPCRSAEAQRGVLEGRVDAIVAETPAVHAGAGLFFRAGTYVRSGIVAGVGASSDGRSGRLDVVTRFHLDPFRESRWAPYAGGGLTARLDQGHQTRGYLLVILGIDGPVSGGVAPSIEAGLGGGGRIGVSIRRAGAERR
jgi:phosphatidylglycerophosphate synthase